MKKRLHKYNYFIVFFFFFSFSVIANAAAITISGSVTYDATYAGADIIIANRATFIINSDAQINSVSVNGGGSLLVNSPYTLTVGVVSNPFTLQVVDFQNNCTVLIKAGASLVVYGLMNNSNNSTGVTFDGTVDVKGNVIVGNGSTVAGSGSLSTAGSITGSGTVFGSGNNCSTGPCSGGNLCTFTNTISGSQAVCSNAVPTILTSSTNASSPTYQWQSSTISGGGFVNISGATSSTYSFTSSLTQTTYYRLKITSSSCTSISSQVTIAISPAVGTPVFALGVSSTRCQGAGGATYTASATNNTGLTYSLDATTLSFAGNSIVAGTGAVTYAAGWSGTSIITVSAAGCNGPKTAAHTVTINTLPTPTFTTSSGSNTCPLTDVTYTTQSGQISYVWFISGTLNTDYSITSGGVGLGSNTVTLKWLTAGSKTVTVNYNNAMGCAGTAAATNTTVITIKTWDGYNWTIAPSSTPVAVPISNEAIVFAGGYTSNGDLSGCSCQVKSGTVTIKTGKTLSVINEINVLGGSLTFEDGASLVQENDAAINTGNIKYKRQTTPYNKFDYIYWSSPVSNQTLLAVSPQTSLDKFFSFDVSAYDWKQEDPNSLMKNGVGYIIRGPDYVAPKPPGLHEASFVGVPNNGVVTVAIPVTAAGLEASALLGNPYPSALDADAFLKANKVALDGTLYFWTHNTAIQLATNINNGTAGSGTYAYTSDDYATYNLTGGTAAAPGKNNSPPSGKIASGQSFFAGINPTGGTVTFNNSMRVGTLGTILDNSQFFKTSNIKSKTTSSIDKNRVWLDLSNDEGAFKQTLVGYITDATNEYDSGYDGETFDGNEFLDFYSVNQDKNLVIQGRALPFDEIDEVPLGYKTTIVGDFTIAVDQTDGLFASQDVFIEDKNTKIVKNLKEGAYNFSTEAGTFNDRFVLRYTNKTLGTGNFDKLESQIVISKDKNELKINSESEIKRITVFDILGRKIFEKDAVNNNEFHTSSVALNKQTGIVKVTLTNGHILSKKVIF